MRRVRCDCGKWIVFGINDEGKRVPLDPSPPVYFVTEHEGQVNARRLPSGMVNHYATCTKANEHHKPIEEPAAPEKKVPVQERLL